MDFYPGPANQRPLGHGTDLVGPFFPTHLMANSYVFEWYADEIREQIRWLTSKSACCVELPADDESVFVSTRSAYPFLEIAL